MNAKDVIEAYVTEVATQLPRRQRNDVAFEVRALLDEELAARAGAAGRAADEGMATEMVRAFGRPSEVAARYRPSLVVIDPADGPRFLRATIVGLAIIWVLGLWKALLRPIDSGWDLLSAAGEWWGTAVLPSLWWPGMLVVGFGLAAWSRRRKPQASEWKPRASDRIQGGRVALAMAILGILAGIFVLLDPRWLLDLFWGGRAAPAAYEALTYTASFRERQGPFLLLLLLLNVPLFVTVLVQGRWPALLRRIQTALSLAICALMTWVVLDGPVFVAEASDRMTKGCLALITALTLLGFALQWLRRVRPAPSPRALA